MHNICYAKSTVAQCARSHSTDHQTWVVSVCHKSHTLYLREICWVAHVAYFMASFFDLAFAFCDDAIVLAVWNNARPVVMWHSQSCTNLAMLKIELKVNPQKISCLVSTTTCLLICTNLVFSDIIRQIIQLILSGSNKNSEKKIAKVARLYISTATCYASYDQNRFFRWFLTKACTLLLRDNLGNGDGWFCGKSKENLIHIPYSTY